MRFFSSPSVGLWAAGVVVASGCSLIASPDEDLLNGSGGDPSTSSTGTTLPSASSSGSQSSSSSSSGSPTSSSASSGGGEGGGPVSSSASQGGGGTGGVGGTGGDGGGGGDGGAGGAGGQGGGVGGQGGQGGGPACVDPETDCAPTGNECIRAICDAGVCDTENVLQGTETTLGQAPGDCRVFVCDGEGGTEEIDDDDDTPAIDPDGCVASVTCVDGAPVPVFENEGTVCGPDDDLTCDDAGACQGCTVESQCPGDDNPCSVVICDLSGPSGVCSRDNEVAGTVVPDPDENCQRLVCNDDAVEPVPVSENDDTDFIDDDNDCTLDECDSGTPTNEALDPGDACAGGFCNGDQDDPECVDCVEDDNCGDNNLCEQNTCDTNTNTCNAQVLVPINVEVADPTNNDCRRTECDGAGNTLLDQFEDPGTTCAISGGTQCNAAGNCITGFCDDNTDCDGSDSFCRDTSCNLGVNQCTTFNDQANGTVVPPDAPTDCVQNTCLNGVSTPGNDDFEIPVTDSNECTTDTCSGGVATYTSRTHLACSTGFCRADNSCVECTQDGAQCPSGFCDELTNTCELAAPTCTDDIENGDETGEDCGGPDCDPCADGLGCLLDSDCSSDFCNPVTDLCATPTCADAFTNGDETDLNCGGGTCPDCANGDSCLVDGDCLSGDCGAGLTCVDPCTNGVQDGAETDVDCGGGTCADCALGLTCTAGTDCTSNTCDTCCTSTATETLFFSEYIEGSSNNKAVEIYNPTGAAIDLSVCSVRLYTSAAAPPANSFALSGSLAAGAAITVCNPSATFAGTCTFTSGTAINFNGDDAVDLFCNGAIVDVIGQIGTDPGTEWGTPGVGGNSTINHTLRRNFGIVAGDTNGADAFVPSAQWTAFAQDTFGGLGSHAVCAP